MVVIYIVDGMSVLDGIFVVVLFSIFLCECFDCLGQKYLIELQVVCFFFLCLDVNDISF